jgi:hypothetical protein
VHLTTRFAADAPWPAARAFVARYRLRYHHDPTAAAAIA